jgi:hypothetical protein
MPSRFACSNAVRNAEAKAAWSNTLNVSAGKRWVQVAANPHMLRLASPNGWIRSGTLDLARVDIRLHVHPPQFLRGLMQF